MHVIDFIESASRSISEKHSFHATLAQNLLPLKTIRLPGMLENVILPVKKIIPEGKIAGVDSGFVPKKLAFLDMIFVRTAGVVFDFVGGQLKKAEYYPRAYSLPQPRILQLGLADGDEGRSVSLERLREEIGAAIVMIEKYSPAYFFIDGSLVPQYQDKPHTESTLNEDYSSIIHLFQKLYTTAQKKECALVSCVEDSRGTRFRQLLQEEILPQTKYVSYSTSLAQTFDASFLDYFLLQGERTFAFPYTKNIQSHAILKDYADEWAKSIFVFYLKASEFDRPIRVEFLFNPKISNAQSLALTAVAQDVASMVYALSSLHKEYSFPSVLIEADLRARLTEQEIESVYNKLVDKVGSKIKMRRNSRPFK